MNKAKIGLAGVISAISGFLGVLFVPVLLLVGCNIIDYVTGLCAAKYRNELINSYKGFRGITKKICMWLLVLVGWITDMVINYTIEYSGLDIKPNYIVAIFVAVWLVINELISILENIVDIGVKLPPFLMPLLKNIQKKVEDKSNEEPEENVDDDQQL